MPVSTTEQQEAVDRIVAAVRHDRGEHELKGIPAAWRLFVTAVVLNSVSDDQASHLDSRETGSSVVRARRQSYGPR
jgi:hypothetical protein